MNKKLTIRVGIIQRVIAVYRKPFFEKLARMNDIALSVFSGQSSPYEAIKTTEKIHLVHLFNTKNHYFSGPLGMICWQQNIIKWLLQFNPDILVLDANPRILSSWVAICKMKLWHRPVLGWGLGSLDRYGFNWQVKIREKIARFFINKLDGIIAYSSKAADDYMKAGFIKNRIFIAYNAIDNIESDTYMTKFGSDTRWIDDWKKKLDLDPTLPIILFVGRLIPQKKVELLIQACIPLFDRCQILIVGDGPIRPNLEALTELYKNKVRFIGHQTGKILAKCYIASDVFVLPGAGGLAIHQAMSYGKPVITSFGDGTESDLVYEGVNGLYFCESDINGLRDKIREMIMNNEKGKLMGKASLSIIKEKINIDKMVESYSHALHEMKRISSSNNR